MNANQQNQHRELDFRFHRVERELLHAEMLYEIELVYNRAAVLAEIKLEIDNLRRKLKWFAGALSRYMPVRPIS